MANFSIGNSNFSYFIQKGRVKHVDEKLETVVSGGGRGFVADGYEKSSMSISSSTITHTNIYLEDANGKQFNVQLTDWKISCLPGNLLTIVSIGNNKIHNRYVLIHNDASDQIYHSYGFNDFFDKRDESYFKLGCLIYAAILIMVPYFTFMAFQGEKFYDTAAGYFRYDNTTGNIAGFIAFMITLVGIYLYHRSRNKIFQTGEENANKLKEKVFQIFYENR